jgi:hypothetical protein
MMHTDVQMRKPRGRLSRHVQNKLGETLHAMFDEIVKEGVPDRFSKLLEQMEADKLAAYSAGEPAGSGSRSDRLVRAQGADQPVQKRDDEGSS